MSFFVLDEWPSGDDNLERRDIVQKWLRSLDLKKLHIGQGYGIGKGSLLWLEEGRVVFEEWSAKDLGTAGIVDRTRKLWRPGSQKLRSNEFCTGRS